MISKDCMVCGNPFSAERATAKYCSAACNKTFQRKGTTSDFVSSDPITTAGIVNVPTQHPAITPQTVKEELHELDNMDDGDDLIKRLNARFAAKGLSLISEEPEIYHFVATGIPEIDGLTKDFDGKKKGGLPRRRISEIYGPFRSGKSSLIKTIMKNNPGLKVLFFDAEGGMIAPPPGVTVVKDNVVESVGVKIIEALQEGGFDLIVIDSVASLVTKKHFDDDPEGKASMARALNPEVKRIVAHLQTFDENGLPSKDAGTAVLFINQLRSTTNSFGAMEYTVGGNALPYFASLRLEFRSASADKIKKKIEGKEMLVGQNVRVTVKKSRFGPIDVVVKYPLMYDTFIDFDEYYREQVEKLL